MLAQPVSFSCLPEFRDKWLLPSHSQAVLQEMRMMREEQMWKEAQFAEMLWQRDEEFLRLRSPQLSPSNDLAFGDASSRFARAGEGDACARGK